MGIGDKLKNLFKKKDKIGEKTVAHVTKPVSRASNFKGEGKVPDALRYAAAKIDAQIAAKKITDARGDGFLGQLKAVEASSASEDAKIISISQIVGGIING
ncbi:MAG: hypothetical protein WDA05_00165 [Candidatus Methanomethylophilaceae archaeon]|jgi:hypothetical protein|nr:hypothetical protein [Candidatus Methanomethylophilaceae archaeon]MDD2778639.1 hypothetical protein [Candidatus Methanomethylophilaceae archaeon]MDD3128465.1 hypothetical protein [Candidatus Methanomethylophilaceae archaeon]MDD4118934.1 hypothetical protein [Candidatus Methanomethylophilaceae archaeon]MDD4454178.1 hypothetical protein [Candidatus Methanomethylophilaceae archaeon]